MKKQSLIILIGIMCLSLYSQNKLEEAISSGLKSFSEAKSLQDMQACVNHFERIAEAEPTEWLPRYYAAEIQTILAFKEQIPELKTSYIESAQKHVDKAFEVQANNSELHTLQGMIYQATIGLDPMKNGQIYSGKAATSFKTATALDPTNPRPIYLQGLSVLNTPEQWGGGKKSAQPILAQAMELFENFTPESEIAPNWGKEDCIKQLKNCEQ